MRLVAYRDSLASALLCSALTLVPHSSSHAQMPKDPGPRPVTDLSRIGGLSCTDVTKPAPGLSANEELLFCAGADEFAKVDAVKEDGLGPTFNFTSCRGCHAYPSSGGTSPPGTNPQYDFAKKNSQDIPYFVKPDGPIMVGRLKTKPDGKTPDGGVHAIFTIKGLDGADGCSLKQPLGDWTKERDQKNVTNRIPTPTFGAGLIEQIDDDTIDQNVKAQSERTFDNNVKVSRGRLNVIQPHHVNGVHPIGAGKENRNGNDGTIARFGWKAQNKSLLVFAGEAYNVEMGISNEVFPTERDETAECQFHTVPNDISHPEKLFDRDPKNRLDALSDVEKFAAFMRFLAAPEQSRNAFGERQSIERGETLFDSIGCSACHTPMLRTSPLSAIPALRNKAVRLYSDLALHKMGSVLDDGISQGQAAGDEFRSAPLWGLGQRVWFMHDGRTNDLGKAIELHYYKDADPNKDSDANGVIQNYNMLSPAQKRDIVYFLRSL
jgi:CxxC motif-containing protein (DUF1111 family)